jgi:hypothetical protein
MIKPRTESNSPVLANRKPQENLTSLVAFSKLQRYDDIELFQVECLGEKLTCIRQIIEF